jgi:hypothetical protein
LKRKLLILNLTLVGATIFTVVQLRDQYRAAKAREAATLNRKLKPAPAPAVAPMPEPPPVIPAGYADIAQKMLFDRSRNPTVVTVIPPPPPPKPVPPFPVLKGLMNLGDGLTAVFADKAGGTPREIKPGDPIGQFTLVSVNEQEAVFAWDGKTFRKPVNDIMDRTIVDAGESGRSTTSAAAPAAAPPPPPAVKVAAGPGADTGAGTKACVPNDSTPAGAVVDGFRKVTMSTPFGLACRWEAAR